MNICGHIIPTRFILGIGPLMVEYDSTSTEYLLYGRRRYHFVLHLMTNDCAIKSEYFNPKESEDQNKLMLEWKQQYISAKEKLCALLGEDPEAQKKHEQDVAKLHDETLTVLESLLVKLAPKQGGAKYAEVINAEKQRVVDNLLEFKVRASSN